MNMDVSSVAVIMAKKQSLVHVRRPPKLKIPKRTPSIVIPPKPIIYPTADKTTCAECTCYPKEEKYQKPKKLKQCQATPLTLYELAAEAVDSLYFPYALYWDVDDVANWMEEVVGLPEYKSCIYDNKINGKRLLRLEDPSVLPEINIRKHEHIKRITECVHKEFWTEYIKFNRSIGLPPRKPLTHCTWFKSRTGYDYGIRQNWTRTDILRWMKIIHPKPLYLDHWDLVWYQKPDFPKLLFGKISKRMTHEEIPMLRPPCEDYCNEYMAKRKFRIFPDIPEDLQYIWMEHLPGSPRRKEPKKIIKKEKTTKKKEKESRLYPKKISLEGLKGKDLILARRLMPKKKFLA